jgi:hypothetical protein
MGALGTIVAAGLLLWVVRFWMNRQATLRRLTDYRAGVPDLVALARERLARIIHPAEATAFDLGGGATTGDREPMSA